MVLGVLYTQGGKCHPRQNRGCHFHPEGVQNRTNISNMFGHCKITLLGIQTSRAFCERNNMARQDSTLLWTKWQTSMLRFCDLVDSSAFKGVYWIDYFSWSLQHTVVLRQGLYYKLDMYDTMGQPLSPLTLEQQYSWIIEDADKKIGGSNCCNCL